MAPLRELALFAGAGGGILAGHMLGWRCVCAVELDDYALPKRGGNSLRAEAGE